MYISFKSGSGRCGFVFRENKNTSSWGINSTKSSSLWFFTKWSSVINLYILIFSYH